jgi:hypothetical protein
MLTDDDQHDIAGVDPLFRHVNQERLWCGVEHPLRAPLCVLAGYQIAVPCSLDRIALLTAVSLHPSGSSPVIVAASALGIPHVV